MTARSIISHHPAGGSWLLERGLEVWSSGECTWAHAACQSTNAVIMNTYLWGRKDLRFVHASTLLRQRNAIQWLTGGWMTFLQPTSDKKKRSLRIYLLLALTVARRLTSKWVWIFYFVCRAVFSIYFTREDNQETISSLSLFEYIKMFLKDGGVYFTIFFTNEWYDYLYIINNWRSLAMTYLCYTRTVSGFLTGGPILQ
jgi:hypothetical protein